MDTSRFNTGRGVDGSRATSPAQRGLATSAGSSSLIRSRADELLAGPVTAPGSAAPATAASPTGTATPPIAPGGARTLPALPPPSPLAFVFTPWKPAPLSTHPALAATCPVGVFFADPPTRRQETSGTVLAAAEVAKRRADIVKAIAAARADRPISADNLQHWLDGTATPLAMPSKHFSAYASGVSSWLAGSTRPAFEKGVVERLKDARHAQGTLLPAALTPGTKGPIRFMQYRNAFRASMTANPHSSDLATALGSFTIHSVAWVQATYLGSKGGFLGIGTDKQFSVEVLRWCVQAYDVYDWNVDATGNASAVTGIPVKTSDLGSLSLPPEAVRVITTFGPLSTVEIKDQYFRDLEVSGVGRAYLIRSEPFEAPASLRVPIAVSV